MNARRTAPRLVLFAALAVLLAAACSPPPTPAPTEEFVEPTAAPAASAVPAEPLVVGILGNGPITDLGWNQALNDAKLALEETYGDRVEIVLVENVVWGEETSRAAEQLIADGADVIVDAVTAGDFTTQVAQAHPDVKFLRTEPSALPNEESFWYHGPQVGYLLGIASGLVSESGKLGYVNAFDIPLLRLEVNAFALGAQSVNPEATVSVATINSWYDPAAAKQATEALLASDADVLWGIVNDPANTIALAEEAGVWSVGTMGDTRDFAQENYISAGVIDFGSMLVDQVGRILDGQWEGNGAMRFYSIPEGMDIAAWGPNVPQDVQDQVNAVRDRIVNEGFDPLAGPITDKDGNVVLAEGGALTGLQVLQGVPWLVPGVEGLE
jgi:basic membrane lipoprotein Med (substrate-binding protein (PBP1-ABC) superfamily)